MALTGGVRAPISDTTERADESGKHPRLPILVEDTYIYVSDCLLSAVFNWRRFWPVKAAASLSMYVCVLYIVNP